MRFVVGLLFFSAISWGDPAPKADPKDKAEETRRYTYVTIANIYSQNEEPKFIGINVMAELLRTHKDITAEDLFYHAETYEAYWRTHHSFDGPLADFIKNTEIKRGKRGLTLQVPSLTLSRFADFVEYGAKATRGLEDKFLLGVESSRWLTPSSFGRVKLDLELLLARDVGRAALNQYLTKINNGGNFNLPEDFAKRNLAAHTAYVINEKYRQDLEKVRALKDPRDQERRVRELHEREARRILGDISKRLVVEPNPVVVQKEAEIRALKERYAYYQLLSQTLGEMFADSIEMRRFLQQFDLAINVTFFQQLAQNSSGGARDAAAFNMYVAILKFVERVFLGELLDREKKEPPELAYAKEILAQVVELRKFLARFAEQMYLQLGAMRDLVDDRFRATMLRLDLLEDRLNGRLFDLRNVVLDTAKATALVADKVTALDDNLLELVGALGDRDLQLYLRRIRWDDISREQFNLTMDAFHTCAVKFSRDAIATGPTKAFRDEWTATSPELGLALSDLFQDAGSIWPRIQGLRVGARKVSTRVSDAPWINPLTWALCADAYTVLGQKFPKLLAAYDAKLKQWDEIVSVGRMAALEWHGLFRKDMKLDLTPLKDAWSAHSSSLDGFESVLKERKTSLLASEASKGIDPFHPLAPVLAKSLVVNSSIPDAKGSIPPCKDIVFDHTWTTSNIAEAEKKIAYPADTKWPSIVVGDDFIEEFQKVIPVWVRLAELSGRGKLEICVSEVGTRELTSVGRGFPVPEGLHPDYQIYTRLDRRDFARVYVKIRVSFRHSTIELEDSKKGPLLDIMVVGTMWWPLGRSEKILMPNGNYTTFLAIAQDVQSTFVQVIVDAGKDRLEGGKKIAAQEIPSLALSFDGDGNPVAYPYPAALAPKMKKDFVYLGPLGVAAKAPETLKAFNAQVPRQTAGLLSEKRGIYIVPYIRDIQSTTIREALVKEASDTRVRLARSVSKELTTSGSALDQALRRLAGTKRLALSLERLAFGSPDKNEVLKPLSESLPDGVEIKDSYLKRSQDWLAGGGAARKEIDSIPFLTTLATCLENSSAPGCDKVKTPDGLSLETIHRRYRGRFSVLEHTLLELGNRRVSAEKGMK